MSWLIDISSKHTNFVIFVFAIVFGLILWIYTKRIDDRKRRILTLLSQEPEMYGRQIVRADPRTQGLTTIYFTLNSMEEGGLIKSYEEDRTYPPMYGPPRRVYSITDQGRQWLNDNPLKKTAARPS